MATDPLLADPLTDFIKKWRALNGGRQNPLAVAWNASTSVHALLDVIQTVREPTVTLHACSSCLDEADNRRYISVRLWHKKLKMTLELSLSSDGPPEQEKVACDQIRAFFGTPPWLHELKS